MDIAAEHGLINVNNSGRGNPEVAFAKSGKKEFLAKTQRSEQRSQRCRPRKMRFFRFALPASFLLRSPAAVYAASRPFIASGYSLFLQKLVRGLCADLCVFARNSSFLSWRHTITQPLSVSTRG